MRPYLLIATALLLPASAFAQDSGDTAKEPRRYRIALGPQFYAAYPGADRTTISPMVDVAVARGDDDYDFEAADESFGFPLWRKGGFMLGPVANFQGKRRSSDVGGLGDEVGTTLELGGTIQYWPSKSMRIFAEVRQGVNGHGGLVSNIGADFVWRDHNKWLFAIGPRADIAGRKYERAYFDVSPRAAATTGLPTYESKGGLISVGVISTATYQVSRRWGVYTYAGYERITSDAADSPIVARYGSRNQFSGGIGLSYTFGKGLERD